MIRLSAQCAALAVFLCLSSGQVLASGSFPVASCAGWSGTAVEQDGIDTPSATMTGMVTKADLQEYCERDPGGETKQNGGKLTVAQCVAKYQKEEGRTVLTSKANCRTGTIEFRYGNNAPQRARFPLKDDEDTSCASGKPPLIAQFVIMCPTAARRMKLN
ncbi:hypothetical protein [Microvirga sesbaniae]|uniref:hypothetical protein n=1 Tax=Microvirga sesbaniae TaxID=681392 RepID=UPI0021C9BD33|nr:hypothetical protein [Microvirga sp. HBU67692]